jgi:hypothetical protein
MKEKDLEDEPYDLGLPGPQPLISSPDRRGEMDYMIGF